jgi:hypothetical protein
VYWRIEDEISEWNHVQVHNMESLEGATIFSDGTQLLESDSFNRKDLICIKDE